ncbi:hypothetical protein FLL45_03370 [Aliikangiella marina]|uniref:Uncharacterized protein n=1 Tax=Aliikangiella marina TaxID=1712262 RepID=A0A545TIK8_9GAMM|nr:hypothetical protein FLL45_03370 [Aliikangiella marina]
MKALLIVILAGIIGICRFSECSAQSKAVPKSTNLDSFSLPVSFKDHDEISETNFTASEPVYGVSSASSYRGNDLNSTLLKRSESSLVSYTRPMNFGGVMFSLNIETDNNPPISNKPVDESFAIVGSETSIRPQITLFSSAPKLSTASNLSYRSSSKSVRHDRYKDTIPAIFRLTLKGYSIMEHSDKETLAWTLNKVDNKEFRKPQLMLSFTKQF